MSEVTKEQAAKAIAEQWDFEGIYADLKRLGVVERIHDRIEQRVFLIEWGTLEHFVKRTYACEPDNEDLYECLDEYVELFGSALSARHSDELICAEIEGGDLFVARAWDSLEEAREALGNERLKHALCSAANKKILG